MKYRIGAAAETHLGGNATVLISGENTGNIKNTLLKKISRDCYKTFSFKKFGYCDAGFDGREARFGVEPAYEHESLKMIIISNIKEESKYVTGRAVAMWASKVVSKEKLYAKYLKKSKFVLFVDKWYPILFPSR